MKEYVYNGPVKCFNTTIHTNWSGKTKANSVAKAKSNLCFQFKKDHGLAKNANIRLPNPIIEL